MTTRCPPDELSCRRWTGSTAGHTLRHRRKHWKFAGNSRHVGMITETRDPESPSVRSLLDGVDVSGTVCCGPRAQKGGAALMEEGRSHVRVLHGEREGRSEELPRPCRLQPLRHAAVASLWPTSEAPG